MATGPKAPDETCQICLSSTYLEPTMKILVAPCCYKICEGCVKNHVASSKVCPGCRETHLKPEYLPQTFEDLGVEKEVRIRKKLMKWFCKRESDFENIAQYNDYLEEVECIIFNVVHDIEKEETQERMARLTANEDEILRLTFF
eukprot:Lithocolla_globosa_v1_NODE_884_length_3130_cov_89.921951.p2 type:complete len:144 gc:universal NODE_884_length_3130_cov_89.921951:1156-1587(+)